MDVARTIRHLGGVAQLDVLRAHGIDRLDVLDARKAGLVDRVRRAWYAVPDADSRLVAAVRIGGAVTCVTAAGMHGLWEVPDRRVHVAIAGNGARLRSLDRSVAHPRDDSRVVLHWRERTWCPTGPLQPIDRTLAHLVECQPIEHAVAVLDSALRRGVSRSTLQGWLRSARGAAALLLADIRGEAGGESVARVRLRRAGYRVEPQVEVPGVGRIDLRVGDRLLVEIDSRAHHAEVAAMANDRRRDREAIRRGYIPLRFMHDDVLHRWDEVASAIAAFADEDRHRSRAWSA